MMGFPGPDGATPEWGDSRHDGQLAPAVRERAPTPPFRAVRSHPLIGTAIILATLLGSLAWLTLHAPTYSAKAEMLLTPLRADDPDRLTLPLLQESGGDPIRTVQTAAALIDSQQAASLAARRLGGDWTAKRVRNATDIQPQGQTSILDITAVGASPAEAARIANTFARAVIDSRARILRPLVDEALKATSAQLERLRRGADPTELERRLSRLQELRSGRDPTISISQRAVASRTADGLAPPIVVALALLAGGLLAIGLVPLIDMFGPRRILSEDELMTIFPLPVLSRIPALPARRRTEPGRLKLDAAVWEAFHTIQVQLDLEIERDRCPVVMFTSPSHSDGKTSSAVDFALQLGDAGNDVVIVDLDLRKPDVATRLGMSASPAASPTARGEPGDYELALRNVPGRPSIHLLEGRALPGLGQGFKHASDRFAQILGPLSADADYVIVDVPPLGEVSDPLLFVSSVTHLVVVARLANTRASSTEITRDLLLRAGQRPSGYLVIGGEDVGSGYYYYYAPVSTAQQGDAPR